MGSHPVNLAFRFVLELIALFSLGYWGWQQASSPWRFILAIGVPLLAAIIWGTFNVRGDPSRSGKAPVSVPGVVRLLIELAFFLLAAWGLYDTGMQLPAILFALAIIIHYILSYDRIVWMLRQS